MKIGKIHDHHDIHNDKCPQNGEHIEKDCTCKKPTKKERHPTLINRAKVRSQLLLETNTRSKVRQFTQVYPRTLDAIEALVKREIIRLADNPPRTGKTL